MARFIPKVSTDTINHDSERIVYEALNRLSDEYIVLHSFPWLRPMRDQADQPLREGEADFIILHPKRGMLVLEVKGGAPLLQGRIWSRNGKAIRDPFDQARRSRYALLEAIEERTQNSVNRRLFTHGDVVVFPHMRYTGPLPVNSDPRIAFDSTDIPSLASRIDDAFKAWARFETSLSPKSFAELLEALMPKLRLMRCASAEVQAEQQRIVQITLDQRVTLLGLLENDRVLVEGTAGSGKTLLATEFAIDLASKGERVLFLCYNRHLCAWLQEQVKCDPRAKRFGMSLEVTTFHSFANRIAKRAGVAFSIPALSVQEFWDDEVPLILEQSLEVLRSKGHEQSYDVVIVDEAQDFAPDWWLTIESLCDSTKKARLYAFLDMNQSVRGQAIYPPTTFVTRFRLTTNCRNTKAIARSSSSFAKVDIRLLPGSPNGEVPAVRRSVSLAAEAGVVLAELRKLLEDGIKANQIALIGPTSHGKGSLAKHKDVNGIPFVEDAADWRCGAGILVTTARAFKGLEADVALLYGLNEFGNLFTQVDLYVAWTRARHRLFLFCQSGSIRAILEQTLAETERQMLESSDSLSEE